MNDRNRECFIETVTLLGPLGNELVFLFVESRGCSSPAGTYGFVSLQLAGMMWIIGDL